MIPTLGAPRVAYPQYQPAQNQRQQQEAQLQAAEQQREARFRGELAHVQSHEAAHYSAAGEFAAGPPVINADYSKKVVYGGHVPIQMKFGRTADEAMSNARKIASAALAPGDPSGQDRSVAASAMSKGSALYAARKAQEEKANRQPSHAGVALPQPSFSKPQNNPFAYASKA